jgi:hypothetical protein
MTDRTGADSSAMPGLRELLQQHVDRTGDSTRELSRKVDFVVNHQRFQQLLTEKSTRLPYDRKTVDALGQLLNLPATTIVKAFLIDIGLPVDDRWSRLAQMLPPDVDELDSLDIEAITFVVRRLVEARKAATRQEPAEIPAPPIAARVTELRPPPPDLSVVAARKGESQGKDKREQQDKDAENHED